MTARMRVPMPMLVGLLLALAPPSASAVFWSGPDPAVAGHPTQVVFSTWSYGGQPDVEVQVEGGRIVLVQSNLCGPDLCFSAPVPATAEATLPPLAPGSYVIEAVWEGVDGAPVELATLEVQDAPLADKVLPADGFWSPVGQSGSGLFLERRGGLLAVSTYSYVDSDGGRPAWRLGVASYSGDTAPLLVYAFHDGDCLGCSDHRAVKQSLIPTGLQLRFESARRAWLDIAEPGRAERSVPIVSLPYGAAYVPQMLTDAVDAEFGPLPLPDLRGTWLFAIEGPVAKGEFLELRLDQMSVEDGIVVFSESPSGSAPNLTCRSASEERRAGCIHQTDVELGPPPAEPLNTFFHGGVFFPLGDIEEDRMRGVIEADGQTWRVRGHRVSPPPGG